MTGQGPAVTFNARSTSAAFIYAPDSQILYDGAPYNANDPNGLGKLRFAGGVWAYRVKLEDWVDHERWRDDTLPSLSIAEPADGTLSNDTTPRIVAQYGDVHTGIALSTFIATRNGTFITSQFQLGPTEATHDSTPLADGSYSYVITIRDVAGNERQASITYHLDATPPLIDLVQTPTGAFVNTDVAVAITVTDPHLDSSEASVQFTDLDGTISTTPYVSGAVLSAEGDYIVSVHAVDTLGNESDASVVFSIDKTPPFIAISGVVADECRDGAVTPIVAITDRHRNPNAEVITLDGVLWLGDAITEDGHYELHIGATDLAGNFAEETKSFTIDTTAPDIDVFGITDGRYYRTDRSPVVSITETNLVFFEHQLTFTNLAGQVVVTVPWTEQTLSEEGDYALGITARDCADHATTQTWNFTIDKTVPTISVVPNLAGLQTRDDVTIAVTFDDRHLDPTLIVATVDGLLFTSSTTITNEGQHHFEAHAFDLAGNEAVEEATFIIDKTAPVVEIVPASGAVVGVSTPEIVASYRDSYFDPAQTGVNPSSAVLRIDGVVVTPTSVGADELRHVTSTLSDGSHTVVIEIADTVGNVAEASSTFEVREPPRVHITTPADLSTVPTIIEVQGTVSDNSGGAVTVRVNDQTATVNGGQFSAELVVEGLLHITAVATDPIGLEATDSVRVYNDVEEPRIAVHWPREEAVLTQESTAVSGYLNDFAPSGVDTSLSVTVNGQPAEIQGMAFGIDDVPLVVGDNSIVVVATDGAGNPATATRHVMRSEGTGALGRLEVVSGSGQRGLAGTALPQPLVVRLVNRQEQPVAGGDVVFQVRHNDGTLDGGVRGMAMTTDATGLASANLTLGSRSGPGLNRVEASATGYRGTGLFAATSDPGPPAYIFLTDGNNQRSAVGQPLPRPLRVRVTDEQFNPIVGAEVAFEVSKGTGHFEAGGAEAVVTTGSDGRAWVSYVLGPEEGFTAHRVRASLPDLDAQPVVFQLDGVLPGPASATSVSGTVVDNQDEPIPEAIVSVLDTSQETQTDSDGRFTLAGVPVGELHIHVDPSTTPRAGTFSAMTMDMVTISGLDNIFDRPIYLPKLELDGAALVSPTQAAELQVENAPGFSLIVAAGSASFPDGSSSGELHVTAVHADRIPMEPMDGQQPRFIVTIQPPGVRFDPPAKIRFPNVDGYPPGMVTELFSFDHDLAQFITIGPGVVTEDGLYVQSDEGVGVIESGWHCGGNPVPPGECEECPGCGTSLRARVAEAEICCPQPNACHQVAGSCDQGQCAVRAFTISLQEVSFSGAKYHTVMRDFGPPDFGAPHWKDNSSPPDGDADDAGDRKHPISFTRNTKMKVSATWRIQPASPSVTIMVRGDGPGNLDVPATTATIVGSVLSITAIEAQNSFVNEIDLMNAMTITWSFSKDGGSTWCPAGRSANQTYITLEDPLTPTYHTVLHVGCKNAKGKTVPAEIVAAIWSEFEDREVKRASDNHVLTYYKPPYDPACPFFVPGLLSTGDGRCGAWAAFMRDTIKAQGIPGAVVKPIVPMPQFNLTPDALFVKSWDLSSTPPGPPVELDGIAGQGTPNPAASVFENHAVVVYGGIIYDPSYGGDPFATLVDWQRASLDAVRHIRANVELVWLKNTGATWPLLVEFGPPQP